MERLRGITQSYAWGSHTLLAKLRGLDRSSDPEAEIWYGAHDAAPSVFEDNRTLLSDIEADPTVVLGDDVVEAHGAKLPFLLKLLAADEPLSIQAHPTGEQARAGFARENAAGVALDAPDRSFRDDAPKPELIAALTPFEALVGFRPLDCSLDYLSSMGAGRFEAVVREQGLGSAVRWALDPAPAERHNVQLALDEVIRGINQYRGAPWAGETAVLTSVASLYPGDAGVLVAALLNRVRLEPGQAMFLGARTLHSYVGGLAVEIMGNSDNVLRGGLTKKNVDKTNLFDILLDETTEVEVITPDASGCYPTLANEFQLSRISNGSRTLQGPAIVLATEGNTTVATNEDQIVLTPTEAVWLDATNVATASSPGCCFIAEVGATDIGV